MDAYIAEFIGTALLILLGCGVVANVVLEKTKGNGAGWIVITFGWAIGVFVGVFVSTNLSADSGHLNPAVTIAFALAAKFAGVGTFESAEVVPYILAQLLGAGTGAFLVWAMYKDHFDATEAEGAKLGVFATNPEIRNSTTNLLSEIIGTFVLVFGVFYIAGATVGDETASLGALDALPVALIVLGIGLCLGGTTGYAINPARDLGPRIIHAIVPMKKGDSDWTYSWIPIVGPIIGGILATLALMGLS